MYKTQERFSECGKDAKCRYFICLGDTGVFQEQLFVYVATTTTKLTKYPSKNVLCRFKAGEYGFTKDCVLYDCDIKDDITQEAFDEFKPNCVGALPKEVMMTIYKNIQASDNISKVIKDNTKASFQLAEIPT